MRLDCRVRHAVAVVCLSSAVTAVHGQILAASARQASSGSLKLMVYYQGVSDQSVNFAVVGAGTCGTGVAGVTFACGQAGDIEGKGFGQAAVLKVAGQIGDYVQPYVVFGSGSYELSVPSTTITNKFTGTKEGLIYGGGVKFSVVPDTLYDTAVALDLGAVRSVYDFDHIAPGGAPGSGPIDQRLTLMTYQLAVEASHLFTLGKGYKLEPYGGIKWLRVVADLKDLPSGGHAGGRQETASPFVGLRWPVGDSVASFVEAAFVDGYHYGTGFEMRFN